LPGRSARFPPRIDETPQVADVGGSVAVFKAKAGQCSLGSPLGGAGEQLIKVFRAQVQDVSAVGVGGFFCHGHLQKEKARTGVNQAGLKQEFLIFKRQQPEPEKVCE
jgi:hypothetical protein